MICQGTPSIDNSNVSDKGLGPFPVAIVCELISLVFEYRMIFTVSVLFFFHHRCGMQHFGRKNELVKKMKQMTKIYILIKSIFNMDYLNKLYRKCVFEYF